MIRILWFVVGGGSLGLGTIGIFLPLLPTVPFYLLAAFAFSKSSDKMHNWLLNHRIFGPDIKHWYENRIIRRPAKLMAVGAMAISVIIALFLGVPVKFVLAQAIVLGLVGRFIWLQKEN